MNSDLQYRATTMADYAQVQAWCEQHCGKFDKDWYRLGRDPLSGMLHNPVPDV